MQESILVDDAGRNRLLATKFFVPASPHALIPRQRLHALLDECLHSTVTLLSAPAGFGKTTLLSQWLQTRSSADAPVAWVSLDEGDNDPVRFWTYVFTALEASQPGLCTLFLSILQTSQAPPPLQSILIAFSNALLTCTRPLLLVLDDFHVITSQAVHNSFTYLVEHLPPDLLHIIISTRTDPPLPLSRLRVMRKISEIRTDQLRCTEEESSTFLQEVMRIELPSSVLGEVTRRTEGWMAGLQLLGLSLQAHTDPTAVLDELRGSQRYILDYLTEEVLRQQPEPMQQFLLSTSISERLNASLCDAIMEQGGSQQMLEELERANLFVASLDEYRHWYRYHGLFAEALRYRLEVSQAALVPTLHLRASAWYEQQEDYDEAVRHALQARDFERAAGLIERVAFMLSYRGSDPVPLLPWLRQLPPAFVRPRPYLCLIYAQMLFLVAPPAEEEDQHQAALWLKEAEDTLTTALSAQATEGEVVDSQTRANQKSLLASILALRAMITSYHGNASEAFSLCEQTLVYLDEQQYAVHAVVAIAQCMAHFAEGDAELAVLHALRASALGHMAGSKWQTLSHNDLVAHALIYRGKLREAWHVCNRAVELARGWAREAGGLLSPNVSLVYGRQAELLREWNQLDDAQELVLQGIELAEQAALLSSLDLGYSALGRIHLARGNLDAASDAFARAAKVDEQLHNPYVQTLYLCVDQVRLWLARGEVERASQWSEELLRTERQTSAVAREREDVTLVRIWLAQERPREALQRLPSLLEGARRQERWNQVIEMLVLQALAYQMVQQESEALASLAEAVRLAEPEGYVRRFVDEGQLMASLLTKLRELDRRKGPTPYLDSLLNAFALDGKAGEFVCSKAVKKSQPLRRSEYIPQQPLLDPLSERELDVLYLLARGASNQEIAQELEVALNTVKHHMSNIISKLGASNRTQAVAEARALGLFSDEP
ncbi:MAG TPA: LuxR C-terminal-related transcriptional regulator [Ktedonobacteraceae bacterium]